MHWWVEFPISAHGGCPCLFAFGLRPLFCLVGSCFVLFCFCLRRKIRISDQGMCTSSLRIVVIVSFATFFVYSLYRDLFVSLSFFVECFSLTLRTEPLSVIGRTRGKKLSMRLQGNSVLRLYPQLKVSFTGWCQVVQTESKDAWSFWLARK